MSWGHVSTTGKTNEEKINKGADKPIPIACEQAHLCKFGENCLVAEPPSREENGPRMVAPPPKQYPRIRTREPVRRKMEDFVT